MSLIWTRYLLQDMYKYCYEKTSMQDLTVRSDDLELEQSLVNFLFDLHLFRYIFGMDRSVLVSSPSDLDTLSLCSNWYYRLKCKSRGVKTALPRRHSPSLFRLKVYIRHGSRVKTKMLPVEKLSIVCAIELFV